MKNLFGLLLLVTFVSFLSCKNESGEYTIVSGKLTNTQEGSFAVNGNAFSQDISVGHDGTFTDTLKIAYNGLYQIGDNEIYLHKGRSLTLDADANSLKDMTFSGELAPENQYWAEKQKTIKEVMGEDPIQAYTLEEAAFLAKVTEAETKLQALFKAQSLPGDFKNKEERSLKYFRELLLINYKNFHELVSGKQDFKVSESYPATDDGINLDNSDDYYFSSSYRDLVQTHFNLKVRDKVGDSANDMNAVTGVALETFKSIKSSNIKNDLAHLFTYSLSPDYDNVEELYNTIMEHVTDDAFKKSFTEQYDKMKNLAKGQPSPKFNYENFKGGTTSLDDLKGKYVYVDVWATWCGPCKREIPHLKTVEKKYEGKNIHIVSISIDQKKDYEKWKSVVKDENLGGIQLFADNDWKSQFVADYGIQGIPRFILIDPNGNIVSSDAPRPSDPKLIELFTELGI